MRRASALVAGVASVSVELPPRVPWTEFMRRWQWAQGEHLTVIGPTGTGKTTLLRACMRKRYQAGSAVAVLATKPEDANLRKWAREDGLSVVRDWPAVRKWWQQTPPDSSAAGGPAVPWHHRLMVWPHLRGADDVPAMAETHRRALTDTFAQGRWCVVAEELLYLADVLKLDDELVTSWTQGRSSRLTLAGGVQRPVNIPLYAYSQATHLFFFSDNDEVNLRRIQGLGGLSSDRIRETVAALPWHDVLYLNTRRRVMLRTRVSL